MSHPTSNLTLTIPSGALHLIFRGERIVHVRYDSRTDAGYYAAARAAMRGCPVWSELHLSARFTLLCRETSEAVHRLRLARREAQTGAWDALPNRATERRLQLHAARRQGNDARQRAMPEAMANSRLAWAAAVAATG